MIHQVDHTRASSVPSSPTQYNPNKTSTAAPTGTFTDPKPNNQNPCRQVCQCAACVSGSTQKPTNTAIKFDLSKLKQPSQTLHDSKLENSPCLGKKGPNNTGEKREAENTKPPQIKPEGKISSDAKNSFYIQRNSEPTAQPVQQGKKTASGAQQAPQTAQSSPQGGKTASGAQPPQGAPLATTHASSHANASSKNTLQFTLSKFFSTIQTTQPLPTSLHVKEAAPFDQPLLSAAGLAREATVQQNLWLLAQRTDGHNVTEPLAWIQKMSSTPQSAQSALRITNAALTLADIHPQALAGIIHTIPKIPEQNIPTFIELMNTLPTLNASKPGIIMLSTLIGNTAPYLSSEVTKAFKNVIQTLSEKGWLDALATNINPMATLQAFLMGLNDVDEHQLLAVIAALLKSSFGDEDDVTKKQKKEKQQARERMIQFLETYVGTGFAIWAEQMHLNKEKKQFIKHQRQANQKFNRQQLLLNGKLKEEHHVAS
jgi:hypothetical protein